MTHMLRIHAPGLYMHIYARGNNKENIFHEDADYKRFLTRLDDYRSDLQFKLYAYCLLPNHFHLLLQVNQIPISKIMQKFMTSYTMYFNKKYHRTGHIFQGRYQSIIIDKDSYLLQVFRYIILNPIKVGLADYPDQYIWSSYSHYFTDLKLKPIVEREEILSMISENPEKQKEQVKKFILDGLKEEFDPIKEQMRGVLGEIKLYQKLTKVLKGSRP